MQFILSAKPIDEQGVVDSERRIEWVAESGIALIERTDFQDWLEGCQAGDAWDLTLEVQ
jgi:hypothetical protein